VKRYRFALALALAGVIARPCAAATAEQGRGLAASCASCHRTDGHDTVIPSIAGLDESRIIRLMLAYRSADQGSQIMHVVAGALSPEEIEAVAHYVALHPSETKQP
jgi:sulfide dehydrogenase cytochrome subunit